MEIEEQLKRRAVVGDDETKTEQRESLDGGGGESVMKKAWLPRELLGFWRLACAGRDSPAQTRLVPRLLLIVTASRGLRQFYSVSSCYYHIA